jgi:adenosine deaminase
LTVLLAELHVHLEGTVRYETAIALAAQHGMDPPPAYEYSDLPGFLAMYGQVSRCMATSQDFERVIVEHGEVMSRQDIAYAEISFNPSLHPADGWLDGLTLGRRRVKDELGIEIAWLVEMVRGAPIEVNERSLAIAVALEGVVGIGLVGDESIPGAAIGRLIESARGAGLGFMPHAGQSGGPHVVREAVEALGATRVAHGIAAAGDAGLLRLLADRNVCLCVCPSSNARIGLRPDFKKLSDHGIPLTVNTDDPAMVPTSLERELALAEANLGLSRDALVAASWEHRFRRER